MKTTKLPITLALSTVFVGALFTGQALADSTQQEGTSGMPKTHEEWVQYLSNFTQMDPRAYANYARTMDPRTITDWTQALMDPQFYTALTYVFTDPNKIYRWMLAPMDPKVMSFILNMLNPNIYLRWGTLGLDPRLWNMLSAGVNPNWYAGWMNTMANPGSYGSAVGGWMQAPYGSAVAPTPMPGMPAYPFMPPMPAPRP